MSLLEQQRSKFVSMGKYLQAAEIVQQVSESRKKLRDLQSELANIQKKESCSQKYHNKLKKAPAPAPASQSSSTNIASFFTSSKVNDISSQQDDQIMLNTESVVCKNSQVIKPSTQCNINDTEKSTAELCAQDATQNYV